MYEYTRMDAIVAERLTSSPRIYNIYGTCGIGILSEYFAQGDVEAMAVSETGYFNYQYYADTDEENEHEPKGQANHTRTNATITTTVVPTKPTIKNDPKVDEPSFSTPAQVSASQRPRSRSHLPPVHNELSGYTKLKLSLHMAEAIADLHGYSGGTIVHQDIVRISTISKNTLSHPLYLYMYVFIGKIWRTYLLFPSSRNTGTHA